MKKIACAALTAVILTFSSAAFADENTQDSQNASSVESNEDCKDGVCKWRR